MSRSTSAVASSLAIRRHAINYGYPPHFVLVVALSGGTKGQRVAIEAMLRRPYLSGRLIVLR